MIRSLGSVAAVWALLHSVTVPRLRKGTEDRHRLPFLAKAQLDYNAIQSHQHVLIATMTSIVLDSITGRFCIQLTLIIVVYRMPSSCQTQWAFRYILPNIELQDLGEHV